MFSIIGLYEENIYTFYASSYFVIRMQFKIIVSEYKRYVVN